MAKSIDDKIVKLSMDNKDLTSKAQQSMSVMDKLKAKFSKADALKTKDSVSALNELNAKADSVTLDMIKNAIDGVGSKFSAMGVIAATVISNITSKFMELASNMMNAAIFKPMMDGFQEYELKMGSIQTILANTARHGTGLEEVSANLDELNTYADKTIYNFGDMTRNIGLFTNAGIKVGDATKMIKGFSNEAATSGTNAQQAAGAAYQLSQALSAGTIRLMDWRSLQNVGMGNKNMQLGLIELTEAMGGFNNTGTNAAEVQKDFNGSLEKGWLSADIMSQYLQIMAEEDANVNREKMKSLGLNDQQIEQFIKQQATAQDAATKVRTFSQLIDTMQEAIGSGWTETWDMIIGDFEEATELWTSVNNVTDKIIGDMSKKRNDFVKGLIDAGAKGVALEGLSMAFQNLARIIGVVTKAFHTVFPPITIQQAMLFIVTLRNMAQALFVNEKFFKQLETIMTGVFSVFSIGIKVVKMIGQALLDMIPDGLGGDFMDLLETVAQWIIGVDKAITPTSKFADILKSLSEAGKGALTWTRDFTRGLINGFKGLGSITGVLGKIFGGLGGMFKKAFSGVQIEDVLNAGFIVTLMGLSKKIGGFMDKIVDSFDGFGKIGDAISEGIEKLGGLTDVLDNMNQVVNVASIVAIAGSVMMIAVALNMVSKIPAQDLFKALEMLALSLAGVMAVLWVISKKNMTGSIKAAATIQAVAFALIEVAVVLKILSSIDPERMGSALFGISVSMGVMILALKSMSKMSGGMLNAAASMVIMATAMVILSGAVSILGKLKAEEMMQGVIALGIIMGELAIFMRIVDGTKISPASAASVAVLTGSIMVMVGAIALLGNMDTGALKQGLVAVGVVLAGFAIMSKVMGGGASFLGAATSIAILAGALNLMIQPLKQIGGMSLDQISTGLITLAGALGIMIAVLHLAKGTLAGSTALVGAAAAIALFTPAIMMLGQLSLGQIGAALLAIGGTFAIVAAAALLLGPASAALIPFALAIGAVGLAVGAVGVVLLGAAAALTTLAGLTVAGVASIVGSLGLLVVGLTSIIPEFINFGVTAFNGLLTGIQQVFPNLVSTVMILISTLLVNLNSHVPEFLTLSMQFVTAMINGFAENIGPLIEAGVNLVVQLIDGMANSIRDNQEKFVGAIKNMMGAVLELLVTTMEEIIVVMFGWIPGVEDATRNVGDAAREGLREKFNPEVASEDGKAAGEGYSSGVSGTWDAANKAGSDVAGGAQAGLGSKDATVDGANLGGSAVTGIVGNMGKANAAGQSVAGQGKSGLGSKDARNEGSTLGGGWSKGLTSKGGAAYTSGRGVAGRGKDGLGSRNKESNDLGIDFGQGFVNGIGSMASAAWDAATSLVDKAVSAIKSKQKSSSPSKVTYGLGEDNADGFINAIKDKTSEAMDASSRMASRAIDGASDILSNEAQKLALMIDLEPVIKPILDLSNISRARLSDLGMNMGLGVAGANGEVITNNNTFNISAPENNARAIAKEVERIIVRR